MKRIETLIIDELPDKAPYPIVFTSAKTGKRVPKLMDVALDIEERRKHRIQTAELNRFIETFLPPPGSGDITFRYATQYGVSPPSFVFFINDVRKVKENLIRYLERALRKQFGFEGTPIRLSFKRRE